MAKQDESESEVLSREEMRSTKGGTGAATQATEAGLKRGERLVADPSVDLEAEALNVLPKDESILRQPTEAKRR
jgi:hypothetical protein